MVIAKVAKSLLYQRTPQATNDLMLCKIAQLIICASSRK